MSGRVAKLICFQICASFGAFIVVLMLKASITGEHTIARSICALVTL